MNAFEGEGAGAGVVEGDDEDVEGDESRPSNRKQKRKRSGRKHFETVRDGRFVGKDMDDATKQAEVRSKPF